MIPNQYNDLPRKPTEISRINQSCNIDLAIEDTITCLMATKSYQEKRRVMWDAKKGIVV
ncbi:MAG: hypothetical protein KAV45_03025 [Calditrichia bacterium]|nr:hypothetical protein [Calditrichia bacterium]